MPYFHITLASRGRATLFPRENELRAAITKLVKVADDAQLLFDIVDDHLHDVVETQDLEGAIRLSRRIRLSLRSIASAPFYARDIAPVKTRAHLKALVRYVLTQPEHHGLSVHPALWTGSCFADLAGTRWLSSVKVRLKEALPRLSWRELLEMVGLPYDPLVPPSDEALASAGVERIAAAAAAAINVSSELKGNGAGALLARRCAAALVKRSGLRLDQLERCLGWSARSITRRAAAPLPKAALLAVRRRLALEDLVARSRQPTAAFGA